MLKSVNAALEQPERGESSWKSSFRAENKRLLCETGHPHCLNEAREVQSRTNSSNPEEDKKYVIAPAKVDSIYQPYYKIYTLHSYTRLNIRIYAIYFSYLYSC